MIEILSSAAANSVQDLGRPGHLHLGLCAGGAMDVAALRLGNLLLDNPACAAGLEIALFPFRLKFLVDCQFALTGADGPATLDERTLYPSWRFQARAGQVLSLAPPTRGARSYLTFAGGIEVETVLGSRATDLKTGFGGFHGRGLRKGDRLPLGTAPASRDKELGAALPRFLGERGGVVPVRITPGAEWALLDDASRQALLHQQWSVTPDSNRMGMRLKGEALALREPLEMLSHGILPGTVQVPPAGQPIIQLVDANTCGGYPKIAHVIEADLPTLAQAPIGACLGFVLVDAAQAEQAQRLAEQELEPIARALQLQRRYS
ncbi:biotin-dependent carboxyltransferase family protein [Pseudomonas japonica]|uniref:Biotin-dependent carboxylase uncharacterized domain-containing protein n=1 Tax=Pseudomonas japonica TaxID=256466 RepID=A0A239LD23_9PSED|nr:biotin-dependent carboxyltransferase family protein [Pseudomonas japonica]SNT27818.1 biotin-dependent carboxylase uncharacterized domain-containing protein [Pseudomonas japonica]